MIPNIKKTIFVSEINSYLMRLLPNFLRKALTGIALCSVTATAWAQEALPYWKDIQTVGVNREPARTAFMTY